jgi:hypothetical protein
MIWMESFKTKDGTSLRASENKENMELNASEPKEKARNENADRKRYKKEQLAIAKDEERTATFYKDSRWKIALGSLGALAVAAGAAGSAATVAIAAAAFPVAVALGGVYAVMSIYQRKHEDAAERARENAESGIKLTEMPESTSVDYEPTEIDFEPTEFDDEPTDFSEDA